MPSDLQTEKHMQNPLSTIVLRTLQKNLNNLQLTHLPWLAGLPLQKIFHFSPRYSACSTFASKFRARNIFPRGKFVGAGVLKGTKSKMVSYWRQAGLRLENSLFHFPYYTVLWHSEVYETLFIRSEEWRVFFTWNSIWISLILPLESRRSINQFVRQLAQFWAPAT